MQVIGVDKRGGVDLKAVIVLVGIFKETVHWVQHLMGQQKEPFSETYLNVPKLTIHFTVIIRKV